MNKIQLSGSEVVFDETGIVWVYRKSNVEYKIADTIELNEALNQLGNGSKMPVLVIPGENNSSSHKVRMHAARPENSKYTLAAAIIATSLAQKLIINFFIRFNKPAVPVKMFASEKKALKWLKEHAEKATKKTKKQLVA